MFYLNLDLDSTGIQVDDRDVFEDSMLEVKVKATGLEGQVQGQLCLRPRTKPDLFGVKAKAKTFCSRAVLEDALGHTPMPF